MGFDEEVEGLRQEINRLNMEIVDKLEERVNIALRIGAVKAKHGLPVVDKVREAKVYEQVRRLARMRGLDEEGVVRLFREIIRLCVEAEEASRL